MRANWLVHAAALALSALLFVGTGRGQPLTSPVSVVPDCGPIFFDLAANASSASFDNRFIGCKTWYVAYTSTGFPALTLTFESSADNGGVPAGFAAFAGAILEGVNPNVALDQANTVTYGFYPWIRTTLTGATAGAGRRLRGTFYGYRQIPVSLVLLPAGVTVTADQGAPNTDANRWPFYLSDGVNPQGVVGNPFFNRLSDGAAAQGVVANPLFNRLSDGAAAQGVVGNPLFNRLSDGAAAQGVVANPLFARLSDGTNPFGLVANPLYSRLSDGTNPFGTATNPLGTSPYLWNGTTWAVQPVCDQRAAITFAGAGNTEIVAAVGGQRIRVCHLSFSLSGASNATLIEGTGAACATGPANVSGPYTNILGLALDLEGRSQVQTAVTDALCVTLSAAVTGGGFVTFARY